VVRQAFERPAGKGRDWWRPPAAVVLAVMAAALPGNGWPHSSPVGGSAGRSPLASWAEDQGYDPAAASFNSLLSFGAMSVIAPAIFGDFQSPSDLSLTPRWSGIMLQGSGFDPAVSTMLNGVAQQELLPTGGALATAEFGIGSSLDSRANGASPPSASSPDTSVNVPTVTGDISDPTMEAGGAKPACGEDEIANALQGGSEYWNDQRTSLAGARLATAQFPPGVFVRPIMAADPLGGLGPSGDRANLVGPGPPGGWCRPGREPFSLSSPL
jgi:hypothetical protein